MVAREAEQVAVAQVVTKRRIEKLIQKLTENGII